MSLSMYMDTLLCMHAGGMDTCQVVDWLYHKLMPGVCVRVDPCDVVPGVCVRVDPCDVVPGVCVRVDPCESGVCVRVYA